MFDLGIALKIVFIVLGVFAGFFATKWAAFKLRVEQLTREKVKNEYVESLLLLVERVAFSIVENLYVDVARDLKAASKDGKLSKEEISYLREVSLLSLRKTAGPILNKLQQELEISEADFNNLLAGEISRAVQMNKQLFSKKEGDIKSQVEK